MRDALSIAEVAAIFRVTEKTVLAWIGAGMPVLERGTQGRGKRTSISLRAAAIWYFETNYERLELERERTRVAKEQADKLAYENAVRRGNLTELDIMAEELGRLFSVFRSRLLGAGAKLGPLANPENPALACEAINTELCAVLSELSKYDPTAPRSRASNGGRSAP